MLRFLCVEHAKFFAMHNVTAVLMNLIDHFTDDVRLTHAAVGACNAIACNPGSLFFVFSLFFFCLFFFLFQVLSSVFLTFFQFMCACVCDSRLTNCSITNHGGSRPAHDSLEKTWTRFAFGSFLLSDTSKSVTTR